jgi:hypothetical protein
MNDVDREERDRLLKLLQEVRDEQDRARKANDTKRLEYEEYREGLLKTEIQALLDKDKSPF